MFGSTAAVKSIHAPVQKSRQRSWFYLLTVLGMLVITYLGFALNLAMDLRKVRPLPSALLIHALCNGLWFALLVVQSGLIHKRQIRLHRTVGFASILLALAIFITGQYAVNHFTGRMQAAGKSPSPFGFYVQWASFGLLYGLGMLFRKTPAAHKRYMIFSALVMMLAGLDRLFEVLRVHGGIPALQWIPTSICLLMIFYDYRQLRRVHTATAIGTAIYVAEVLSLVFARPLLQRFGA